MCPEDPHRSADEAASACASQTTNTGSGSISSDDEYSTYLALPCSCCGDLLPTRNELLSHRQAEHPDRQPYQCPACMATFRRGDLLVQHTRTHTLHRPHACSHPGCTQRFSMRSHVVSHTRAMHPRETAAATGSGREREHRCPVCADRVFQSAQSLANHQRCHSEDRPFVCTECKVTFKYRSGMSRHINKHHLPSDKFSNAS